MTQPTQRKGYRNPPIQEALVEFQTGPGVEWDPTIVGKLHEKVKASYPGKPRQQKLFQASIHAAEGQPTGVSLQEGIGRFQLVDADGLRLLSLGPDVLSVNVLKPYDGWEHFRPRITNALRAYVEVSGADRVSRIGVRYVNKVVVSASSIPLPQYFSIGPSMPPGLPGTVTAFLNRAEHVFEDGAKLIVTFASIDAEKGTSALLLDLDVVWEGTTPLDISAALEKVDDLHEREGDAFEALITDKTREVFNAT
jgi:uncharacterized protein (TIGR04255 family)